jgi:hypothetical protein
LKSLRQHPWNQSAFVRHAATFLRSLTPYRNE